MAVEKDIIDSMMDECADVVEERGLTPFDMKRILRSVPHAIKRIVIAGGKIAFPRFGTFSSYETKPTRVRHRITGEMQDVPSYRRPKFNPAPAFRREVADGREEGLADESE